MSDVRLQRSSAGPLAAFHQPYVRPVALAFLAFLLATALMCEPAIFDRPVTHAINIGLANHHRLLDYWFHHLDSSELLGGDVLVTLLCCCWFGTDRVDVRARMVVGILVAFPVGVVSRALQYRLTTHPRPIYDPQLGFHPLTMFGKEPLNTWNSFPSDHATVFGATVTIICCTRPKLAWVAIPWFVMMEFARNYVGAHYPSDLIAGAALGVMAVWLTQVPPGVAIGTKIMTWERTAPAIFYGVGFLYMARFAALFGELRQIGADIHLMHLL